MMSMIHSISWPMLMGYVSGFLARSFSERFHSIYPSESSQPSADDEDMIHDNHENVERVTRHGHSASIGADGVSRRVSPYPSRNASPRARYGDLEDDDGDDMSRYGLSANIGTPDVPRRVSPYPSPNASPRVRYWELGEEEDGDTSGHGHSTSIGASDVPRRCSPYPSPNASPRVRYGDLEDDDGDDMSRYGLSASIGTLGNVPRRISPYPSPNASPRVRYGELEEDDGSGMVLGMGMGGMSHGLGLPNAGGFGMGLGISIGTSSPGMSWGLPDIGESSFSAGYGEEVAITGRGTYLNDGAPSQGSGRRAGSTSIGADSAFAVAAGATAKQNNTTGHTASASIRPRKKDASFTCTVPGCNATFTRSFNLKGHLRSHSDKKPFKCNWPGCGKEFARQHDCRRHEQLHSNNRPFECEGCTKRFARTDALNRHLRSEAGAECAKIVEKSKENGAIGLASGSRDVEMQYDESAKASSGDAED